MDAAADHQASNQTAPPAAQGAWRHLPNALTTLRVVITIAFITQLSLLNYPEGTHTSVRHPLMHYAVAAFLFIVAALTDALDGHLARRWNATTRFGRVMDPFADKLLILGAFVVLAGPGFLWVAPPGTSRAPVPPYQVTGVYPWMVVLVLGRELLVTSLRAVLESEGVRFPADWAGKLKMILQSAAVPTILGVLAFFDPLPGKPGRIIIDTVVWLTLAVTLLSGIPYVIRGIKLAEQVLKEQRSAR